MDKPLPESSTGYELRPGVVVREWPSKYLKPMVARGLRLYDLHRQGLRITNEPVALWPFRLLQVIERCDVERRLMEAPRG